MRIHSGKFQDIQGYTVKICLEKKLGFGFRINTFLINNKAKTMRQWGSGHRLSPPQRSNPPWGNCTKLDLWNMNEALLTEMLVTPKEATLESLHLV